jgi:acetyltransferase-like isoleucine patch superfamily enzyme
MSGQSCDDQLVPLSWRRLSYLRLREWRAWLAQSGDLRVFLLYPPGPGPILMSWLRKRWLLFRNPHCHIEFQGPVYLGPGFSIHAPHGGHFIVGPGVEFRRGFRAELGAPEAVISIGAMTHFTYDVIMLCTTSIAIGRHCGIGQSTLIVDGNHRYFDGDEVAPLRQGYDYRPLVIADYVSITNKATVMADIGTRTVIGAHAVVTKPMPPYSVVGGVPARVIASHAPTGPEPSAEPATPSPR